MAFKIVFCKQGKKSKGTLYLTYIQFCVHMSLAFQVIFLFILVHLQNLIRGGNTLHSNFLEKYHSANMQMQ